MPCSDAESQRKLSPLTPEPSSLQLQKTLPQKQKMHTVQHLQFKSCSQGEDSVTEDEEDEGAPTDQTYTQAQRLEDRTTRLKCEIVEKQAQQQAQQMLEVQLLLEDEWLKAQEREEAVVKEQQQKRKRTYSKAAKQQFPSTRHSQRLKR